MSHILFVNVAQRGHVYPTLTTVTELVRRGHSVSYTSTSELAGQIEAAGAEVVPYTSAITPENTAEAFARDDGSAAHMLYLAENAAILRAARAGTAPQPPDLVVYGDFPIIAGQVLAHRWRRPAVRTSAAFASDERYSFSRDLVESAGFEDPLTVPRFRERLAALLAEEGLGVSAEECWNRVEDSNLVFLPRSFQIAGEGFDERFAFVGPCLGDRGFLGSWKPPQGDPPVVLVSLGTTFGSRPEFFRECARAFGGTPWHVVVTLGGHLSPEDLGPLPPNVEAHDWVSHQAVLEHARVCVTHGGMGTLMEAFSRGRPAVCVPHSPDVAPMVRQVGALSLGAVLPPGEADATKIREQVERVSQDERILERVGRLRREIRSGGPSRAADALEDCLARSQRGPGAPRRT
ncbi:MULTISPECIES: macrolide family glycosyltransferase [unclassified Nocardiopsis]|uniref:macrolide family glycosyltransferase n=1 Tax=unclassified Nocardiopsis TaxID=2649073 RepID=UPI00135A9745|nr:MULTISPECIES: macrolide family glycosyltransferase [unclassified Nocardiopsis]